MSGFLKRNEQKLIDAGIKDEFQKKLEELKDKLKSPEFQEKSISESYEKTAKIEKEKIIGIYVYSYPHYHNNPVEPSEDEDGELSDRTFYKVGFFWK